MAKDTSLSYVFAKRPVGEIVPGTFRAESGPAPTEADLKDGEVLFETHYLGMEPSMRVWLKGMPAQRGSLHSAPAVWTREDMLTTS